MASDSFHGLSEEASCSICLEYFQDPVITECGHNFCRACLAKCWEGSEGEEIACPQCREKVWRKLIPNRQLANLVEKLRRQEEEKAKERKGVCEKHQEPLKLFCKDDEAPICVVCDRAKEHRDHQVVPMDEVIPQYQDQITRHLERLKEEMAEITKFKEETEKESQDLLKQMKNKMKNIKAKLRELHQFLEEQEKLLGAQLEEVEKEVSRKCDEHLAKLSEELSSLGGLIQEIEEKSRQSPAEFLRDLRGILQSSEKRESFQKPVVFSPQLKWRVWEISDRNASLASTMDQFKDSLLPGLQLQKAKVTLNPRTAHPVLILSDDYKRLRSEGILQDLPDYPERFDLRSFVLGREAFTAGRHYWEVTLGNEGYWAVGVARKYVQRKGQLEMSTHEGIWSIGTLGMQLYKNMKGNLLHVKHQKQMYEASNEKIFSTSQKLKRIWVSVNYGRRQVAFHDAETGSHLYTFSGASFSGETLFPFFFVAGRGSLKITS